MSYATERSYIMKAVQDYPGYSTLGDFGFENMPNPEKKGKPYANAEIVNFDGFQVSQGGSVNNLHRYLGMLQVTFFAIAEKGISAELVKASNLGDYFTNKTIIISGLETIKFEEATVQRGRPRDGYFPIILRCSFYRNEYK